MKKQAVKKTYPWGVEWRVGENGLWRDMGIGCQDEKDAQKSAAFYNKLSNVEHRPYQRKIGNQNA